MIGASPPRRTARRRRLAAALRHAIGGRHAPAAAPVPDAVRLRLAEMAAQAGPGAAIPADADLAELLARLRLDDMIPPDVVAAICAALLPVLATPTLRDTP